MPEGADDLRRVSSASPWEESVGFSRAVSFGGRVLVSGTAPVWPDGSCDPDPGVQTRRCFEIVAEAISGLGASLTDVVRTRLYIVDPADAVAIGAAHRTALGDVRPASTMVVVAGLLDPRWTVEIEVEARLAGREDENSAGG